MGRIQEIAEVDLGSDTVRCIGCRNRVGLEAAVIVQKGVVCCRRCWERRDALPILRDCGYVAEVVA